MDALLEIHKKYSNMIDSTFNKDQGFLGARDKVCIKFCFLILTFCTFNTLIKSIDRPLDLKQSCLLVLSVSLCGLF